MPVCTIDEKLSLLGLFCGASIKNHTRTPFIINYSRPCTGTGGAAINCSSMVLDRKTRGEANKMIITLWFKTYSAVGENQDPSLFSRKISEVDRTRIDHIWCCETFPSNHINIKRTYLTSRPNENGRVAAPISL